MSREKRGRGENGCREMREVGRQSEAKRDREEEEEEASERRAGKVIGVSKGCCREQQHL